MGNATEHYRPGAVGGPAVGYGLSYPRAGESYDEAGISDSRNSL